MARHRKSKTPVQAVLLIIVCTIIITITQAMLKIGLRENNLALISSGILLLLFGGVLLTYALRLGDLSVLHPLLSLSFVWVLIGSWWLGEQLGWHQYAGVALIVVGVSLIGGSSRS